MNLSLVERIADAVLYEGYILYPYRPSSVKNQQRWNFGALCPESYSLAQGGTESWTMQTECIVERTTRTTLDIKVRFLHLVTREVGKRVFDCNLPSSACGHCEISLSGSVFHFQLVGSLEVNGKLIQHWQEAVERDVSLPGFKLTTDTSETKPLSFSFPSSRQVEPLYDECGGELIGVTIRKQCAIEGEIETQTLDCGLRIGASPSKQLNRVSVRILNRTSFEDAGNKSRDEALLRSLVSTHTILAVHDGRFVSLLDPPEEFRQAALACSNIGTYPVLAGEEGSCDCLLSSPIILYDYPQIAPESAGNLFDGTEIDEILTLRIMTLTEDEKREMRAADDQARMILERTETLPVEHLMKMHGAMKRVGRK